MCEENKGEYWKWKQSYIYIFQFLLLILIYKCTYVICLSAERKIQKKKKEEKE